jgi:hypothetical protein
VRKNSKGMTTIADQQFSMLCKSIRVGERGSKTLHESSDIPTNVRRVLSFSNASSVMQLLMLCARHCSRSSEELLILSIGEQRKIVRASKGRDKIKKLVVFFFEFLHQIGGE